ncbi:MAG: AmmeMemoRadiSam system radical SAM enzyme [Candidatus Omnitrophica bacterium]|nr:AmmeMemoRadiSam system radical SAM enzyme [Candidatus Omnitrophota bacterium]
MRLTISLALLFVLIFATLILPDLFSQEKLIEASFYSKLENKSVQCQLCPRRCFIKDGKRGFCGVRENRNGSLYTLVYAKAVAIHIDPIEKKPLFHFFPSTTAYSVATAGCNLKCKFCQNWEISQSLPEDVEYRFMEPEDLVKEAKASNAPTIAYTYNEPTIFYEYMLDTAKLARKLGIKNIMHSNGYINEQPLRSLAKYLDAANIDLKGFSDDYYAKLSEGSLSPVLRSLKVLKDEGVHIEITTLLLSGFNDDEPTLRKMCLWIKDNLGSDTPLHFSRFFPMYKLTSLNPTPVESLLQARKIALSCGLRYVYIGNIATDQAENTYCPKCSKLLIERRGYFIVSNNLKEGRCKFCGEKISGVWN